MRSHRSAVSLRARDFFTLSQQLLHAWRRRGLCLLLIFGLLSVPNADYAVRAAGDVAVHFVKDSLAPLPSAVHWVKHLFSPATTIMRQDNLTDRLAYVARLQITPPKLVGYQGQPVNFTALAFNATGEIIQGVRFDWESSNADKVQIDDSGMATFQQPGLARITCHAGATSATSPVLVRPGRRPPQSDAEWRADQNDLRPDGTTSQNEPASTGGIASLLDRLAPTAYAQGGTPGYNNADFPYDELWSEPRNLIGAPPDRAIEATRMGAVIPESYDFEKAIPLVELSGRGMNAGLTLYYNSRVWFRHGSAVTFDAVESRPSPGFSLGFGRLLTYGPSTALHYLWVSADGTRHYLGQGGSATQSVTLQTTDGTHLTFVGSGYGGALYNNDGTKISIGVVNNRLVPGYISDRNGNYIMIAYKSFNCDPGCDNCACPTFAPPLMLDYVTDTLGRVIHCNYDSTNNLISITGPGFGGTAQQPVTQTFAQFDYESRTVSNNFSGLTVENRPAQAINFLKHVYLPAKQTGYMFSYTAFGTIYNVSSRRQMSSQNGSISDGLESNSVTFNYQTASTPALADAPAFTQRTETAVNAPQSLYSYSRWEGQGYSVFIITQPDGTRQTLARYDPATAGYGGLLYYVQPQKADGFAAHTTFLTYTTDGGGSPQVLSVNDCDETGAGVLVSFDYDQYGNVTNKREYGYLVNGQWLVRRRTRIVYKTDVNYVNGYLRSLPVECGVYDAQLDTNDANDLLLAKTTYTYDDYQAMGGMDEHRDAQGNLPVAPGHFGSYDASLTQRGNITGTSQWYDTIGNLSYTWLRKIDLFGNAVKEQLSCCNQQTITESQNTYWALPEQVTKGTAGGPQLTTTAQYDFNTNRVTSTVSPAGLTTIPTYDAGGRVTASLVRDLSGNSLPGPATAYSDSTLTVSDTFTYDDNGTTKTLTNVTNFDGWGRTIQAISPAQAQVNTTFDSLGRVAAVSNPFAAGGSPSYWTAYSYDALGRQTTVTLPDNQTIQTSYSGNSVIVTEQVSRKLQRLSDGLGRLVTVNEQDAAGNLTQATNYSYDALDNMTQVNQGGQLRAFKYDALSRMTYERLPEQSATINDGSGTYWSCKYTYTDFNALASRKDARGVITTYSYDTLHRPWQTTYDTSSAAGVAATDSVILSYNANGSLGSTSVGNNYSESYGNDSFGRRTAVTKFIAGSVYDTRKAYTFSFTYNGASQPLSLTYPSGTQVSLSYDGHSQPNSVAGVSGINFNVAGQVTGDTLANGVTEQFEYDPARLQLIRQRAGTASPYTNRMNLTYSYSAVAGQMGAGSTAGNAGQLMGIVPDTNNSPSTINGLTESAAYVYDNAGRLVTSTQTSNGNSAQRRFVYDRWGNRTAVYDASSGGTQIQSVALQQSGGTPTNQVASVTSNGTTYGYTHDNNGNIIFDGSHSYQYDAENRVVSVDGGAAQYRYDAANHRVCKIIGSSWTHFLWQNDMLLAEHDGTTAYGNLGDPPYGLRSAKADYLYAGSRMVTSYQWTHTTTCSKGTCTTNHTYTAQYYLSDRLSLRLGMDTAGNVVGQQGHLPFGEDWAESGLQQKQHFTSYQRDAESGNDYAINRGYRGDIGRFMQADPYLASASASDPQTLNRYAYAHNNPVNRIDPLGLEDGFLPGGGSGTDANWWWTLYWGLVKSGTAGGTRGLLLDSGENTGSGDPASTCSINVRMKRNLEIRGSYSSAGRFGPVTTTGPQENPVPDGFWGYTFEIEVFLPADEPDPNDWDGIQRVAERGSVFIMFAGQPLEVRIINVGDGPGGTAPDGPDAWVDRTHRGYLYWTDFPSIQKVARDPDHHAQPVEFGEVKLSFLFEAHSKKNPSRKCSATGGINLKIKDRKANWSLF